MRPPLYISDNDIVLGEERIFLDHSGSSDHPTDFYMVKQQIEFIPEGRLMPSYEYQIAALLQRIDGLTDRVEILERRTWWSMLKDWARGSWDSLFTAR